MKRSLALMLGGLATALIPLFATAQPAAGGLPTADCSKARDPARCEARQRAREDCKDKHRAQKRQCLEEQMPLPDCSKAKYPERCAATVAASEACRGKFGPAHRQCLRVQLKPLSPTTSPPKK